MRQSGCQCTYRPRTILAKSIQALLERHEPIKWGINWKFKEEDHLTLRGSRSVDDAEGGERPIRVSRYFISWAEDDCCRVQVDVLDNPTNTARYRCIFRGRTDVDAVSDIVRSADEYKQDALEHLAAGSTNHERETKDEGAD